MPSIDALQQLYATGGPVIAVLAAMSLLAATIILAKALQFSLERVHRVAEARTAVGLFIDGDTAAARALVEKTRAPAARIAAEAMAGLADGVVDEEKLRETVTRLGNDELRGLRSGLRPLELIASLAPLLGLLGTVLGMIEAFQAIERDSAGVSPAVLSGGIWQALSTTAFGLGVAIPAVAALGWLESRLERLGAEMESLVSRLFTRTAPTRGGEAG